MGGTIMVKPEVKYCDKCQKDVETAIIQRHASYTFKGETFEITERVLQCSCGEDLYDELLDSETMKILIKLYQERIGLSLEDIKSIRSQYGLSMNLFSRILGWSKATIARYETGKFIPDSSHMHVLKQLKEKPEIIDNYFQFNKHKFNEKEQIKLIEKLSSNNQNTVEKGLNEVLNTNYKSHEKTIYSGFCSFDLKKLINMILFFTQNGIQKTKLMKLLFYADFLNYKRNLISISGMAYVRLPFGPVPKDHDLLLSTIEKNEFIEIDYDYYNEYSVIKIKAREIFDDTLFNVEEINILRSIQEQFISFGSVGISEYSHKEDGWKYTDNRDIISYDYADTLSIQ
jgi:putative zinc finger/helix-turn-helix YgiT family protein